MRSSAWRRALVTDVDQGDKDIVLTFEKQRRGCNLEVQCFAARLGDPALLEAGMPTLARQARAHCSAGAARLRRPAAPIVLVGMHAAQGFAGSLPVEAGLIFADQRQQGAVSENDLALRVQYHQDLRHRIQHGAQPAAISRASVSPEIR